MKDEEADANASAFSIWRKSLHPAVCTEYLAGRIVFLPYICRVEQYFASLLRCGAKLREAFLFALDVKFA